jgi:NAD(P)-dependent dehydrogenase (short-subunit alcohol dehydrogenase family)
MKFLRGKKALVTGAASGIGRSIALALAREGVDLYLVDIDDVKIDRVASDARRHSIEVRTAHCDLTRPEQITAVVKSVLSGWGRLNILVNNAGVAHWGPTHEMTGDQWNRVLAVNLMAPIQLVREFLPSLRSNEAHILNVCSIVGLVSTRKAAAYQTSKFGLVGLSAALRAEYGCSDFGVTALCPGFVHTPMVDELETSETPELPPEWMFADLDSVAAAAIRAIRRDKGIAVVPPVTHPLWLLARLSPAFVDWLNRRGKRSFGRRKAPSR